jgi:hypothetical protein
VRPAVLLSGAVLVVILGAAAAGVLAEPAAENQPEDAGSRTATSRIEKQSPLSLETDQRLAEYDPCSWVTEAEAEELFGEEFGWVPSGSPDGPRPQCMWISREWRLQVIHFHNPDMLPPIPPDAVIKEQRLSDHKARRIEFHDVYCLYLFEMDETSWIGVEGSAVDRDPCELADPAADLIEPKLPHAWADSP